MRKLTTEEFKTKAGGVHGDKYDYSNVEYVNARTPLKIRCRLHDYIFEQSLDNHINKRCGCPKCSGKYRKSTVEWISEADVVHGGKYDYSDVIYVNNKSRVSIKCKVHGSYFSQNPNDHLGGHGCPLCCESFGESRIGAYLDKVGINYNREYTFADCKFKRKLPYDFYLPEYNMLIEYDGKQHFRPIEYFGGMRSFLQRKRRDVIKDIYAKRNGMDLMRISYHNKLKIEELLKEKLYDYWN